MIGTIGIANILLARSFDEAHLINPMKLQRLLYIAACEYLKEAGSLPFTENFAVWAYGPVLQSVHWKFGCFRTRPIKVYGRDALGYVQGYGETIDRRLEKFLNRAWFSFRDWSTTDLSDLLRKDGSAWYKAFQEGRETISKEDMLADFSYANEINC